MITISSKGDFRNTDNFLKKMSKGEIFKVLDKHAQAGVSALRGATPKETGVTADSWTYEILNTRSTYSIIWDNHNIVEGRPIAILLQYGHGTATGGWVRGRDYINPALRPIFDQILHDVWKEVTSA
jgi:hypothetical protein